MSSELIIRSPKEIQFGLPGKAPTPLGEWTTEALVLPSAIAERDELLDRCEAIEQVAGKKSQEAAVELLSAVGKLLSRADESHKLVKKPFWDIGKKIDKVREDFIAKLETQKTRLKKLLTDFEILQQREADELRRKQEAELARIRAEKERIAAEEARRLQEEADRLAQLRIEEDERQRAAAEAARLADPKVQAQLRREEEIRREAAEQRLAEEEARRTEQLRVEAEAAEKRQAELNAQAASQLTVVTTFKAAGMAVKKTRKFRVAGDRGLWTLCKTHPQLVTIEPRTADINKLIREVDASGEYLIASLPGLELYLDTDVSTR